MSKEKAITHAQLVKVGKLWATGQRGGCRVALIEFHCEGEIPDVLGFRSSGLSIMIECKASRADFLGDKKKYHRRFEDMGMGMQKWYLVGPGVLKDKSEIPEGWGCLEYNPSKHANGYFLRRLVTPKKGYSVEDFGSYSLHRERKLLISACARAVEAQRLTAPIVIGVEDFYEEEKWIKKD